MMQPDLPHTTVRIECSHPAILIIASDRDVREGEAIVNCNESHRTAMASVCGHTWGFAAHKRIRHCMWCIVPWCPDRCYVWQKPKNSLCSALKAFKHSGAWCKGASSTPTKLCTVGDIHLSCFMLCRRHSTPFAREAFLGSQRPA